MTNHFKQTSKTTKLFLLFCLQVAHSDHHPELQSDDIQIFRFILKTQQPEEE